MANVVEKSTSNRIELGDDMDDFILVLDPARRIKTLGDVDTEQQKTRQKADIIAPSKDTVLCGASNPQGRKDQNIVKPPTAAMKKALDKYHADMRKLAEHSMPIHRGLRVPCDDWFCSNRGRAYFKLDIEL